MIGTCVADQALPAPLKPPEHCVAELRWPHLLSHKMVEIEQLQVGFSNRWLSAQLKDSKLLLEAQSKQRSSDTCVIAGNGPSLNDVDWSLLAGTDVFASNYAFQHPELAKHINFLSVVNPWVVAQAQDEFREFFTTANAQASSPSTPHPGQVLITPYHLSYWLADCPNHYAVDFTFDYPPAQSLNDPLSVRSTVTYFNLQLAINLGYRKIILVGLDHSYEQPSHLAEGALIAEDGHDPNHFSSEYFANKFWQAADTDKMTYVYLLAAEVARRKGIQIINASSSTKLKTFPQTDLISAMAPSQTDVTHTEAAHKENASAVATELESAHTRPGSDPLLLKASRLIDTVGKYSSKFDYLVALALILSALVVSALVPSSFGLWHVVLWGISSIGAGGYLIGNGLARRRLADQQQLHIDALSQLKS